MKNDWCSALHEVMSKDADVIPVGWLTLAGAAKQLTLSEGGTRQALKRLLANKRVAVKCFKVKHARRVVSVPHYKLL